jgi:hypothetical protein
MRFVPRSIRLYPTSDVTLVFTRKGKPSAVDAYGERQQLSNATRQRCPQCEPHAQSVDGQ